MGPNREIQVPYSHIKRVPGYPGPLASPKNIYKITTQFKEFKTIEHTMVAHGLGLRFHSWESGEWTLGALVMLGGTTSTSSAAAVVEVDGTGTHGTA